MKSCPQPCGDKINSYWKVAKGHGFPQPVSRLQSSQCKSAREMRNPRNLSRLSCPSTPEQVARARADVETPKDETAVWWKPSSKTPPESSQLKHYPGMACLTSYAKGLKMVLTVIFIAQVWSKAQLDLALLTLPSPLCKLTASSQPATSLYHRSFARAIPPLPAPSSNSSSSSCLDFFFNIKYLWCTYYYYFF